MSCDATASSSKGSPRPVCCALGQRSYVSLSPMSRDFILDSRGGFARRLQNQGGHLFAQGFPTFSVRSSASWSPSRMAGHGSLPAVGVRYPSNGSS